MSLRTGPVTKVINSLATGTVTVSGGAVSIPSLGISFPVDAVESCYRSCTTACTPQVTTVTPLVPAAPCECPWTFEMVITRIHCNFERSWQIFEHNYTYNYVNPSGDAPTAALISASITAQINADPNSPVTAVDNTGTVTLTEKDCDTQNGTCGFRVSGNVTQVTGTAHVDAILPLYEIQREFPNIPGFDFGYNPQTAFCANTYCVYYFKVKPYSEIHDPHVSNAYVSKYREFRLFVRSDLANITTDWDTELTGALTCLGAPLV